MEVGPAHQELAAPVNPGALLALAAAAEATRAQQAATARALPVRLPVQLVTTRATQVPTPAQRIPPPTPARRAMQFQAPLAGRRAVTALQTAAALALTAAAAVVTTAPLLLHRRLFRQLPLKASMQ